MSLILRANRGSQKIGPKLVSIAICMAVLAIIVFAASWYFTRGRMNEHIAAFADPEQLAEFVAANVAADQEEESAESSSTLATPDKYRWTDEYTDFYTRSNSTWESVQHDAASSDACKQACSSSPACKGYTFVDGNCGLVSDKAGETFQRGGVTYLRGVTQTLVPDDQSIPRKPHIEGLLIE